MEKILISECLLGEPIRYDGKSVPCEHELLTKWKTESRLITCCPEVSGGLPVPRDPVEIQSFDGSAALKGTAELVDNKGKKRTKEFVAGAYKTFEIVQKENIRLAILKAKSPSCGNEQIYDGSFSRTLKKGQGVTAALLTKSGIKVFNETQLDEAADYLAQLENS